MALYTYGVSYPAGLRHPELVPTGTQTAFRLYETISWEGEKKARSCMAFVREFEWAGEHLSSSLYSGGRGGGGLKFQPTKHAPTKQGKHVPTKHGENMFPCPWCSHMGLLLEICPRGNNKMVIIIFPCS